MEWGVASRAMTGETDSGDRAVALATDDGALIAVVDGLGHGPEAATAAAAAVDVLSAHADEPPPALLQRCHAALRRTRGAAISVASVTSAGALVWTGVGNVQGLLAHVTTATGARLAARGGIVGLRMPAPRTASATLQPGDAMALYTDGVEHATTSDLSSTGDVQRCAERLLDRHATGTDDALVLVARYRGGSQ